MKQQAENILKPINITQEEFNLVIDLLYDAATEQARYQILPEDFDRQKEQENA